MGTLEGGGRAGRPFPVSGPARPNIVNGPLDISCDFANERARVLHRQTARTSDKIGEQSRIMTNATVFAAALTMFVMLLAWAAVSDYRRYLIPNQVTLGALALYPVFVLSAPEPTAWVFALVMAAVFFAVGFAMYMLRAMGAGDAKLMPVVVLWAGPKEFTLFLIVLLGASFVLAGWMGARTALAQIRAEDRDSAPQGGAAAVPASPFARAGRFLAELRHVPLLKIQVPYGVAISAAGIAVAVNTMFTTLR